MKAIVKYILRNGARDRLYLGVFVSLIVAFAVAIFLGSTMLVEQQQTTMVFCAGSSRVILMVGMILFVCLSLNRAFENKEVEFILSKNISRQQFILAYLLGFYLSFIIILIPLLFAIFIVNKVDILGFGIWSISIILEGLLVICFALLVSLILKNAFSAIISCFAFYLISRLMGVFVMAIEFPQSLNLNLRSVLATILKLFSVLFPRLDLYGQSQWLSYGFKDNMHLSMVIVQFIIYFGLLIFMAFHDFKKKQF